MKNHKYHMKSHKFFPFYSPNRITSIQILFHSLYLHFIFSLSHFLPLPEVIIEQRHNNDNNDMHGGRICNILL
jgi:hypothetical protein